MAETDEDPRCPECGGPIGQTATYCMHCSADLTEQHDAADADGDEAWDQTETGSEGKTATAGSADATDDQILDPDGLVDNTLTAVVGVAGGIAVGLIGTVVLLIVTGSGWALAFGFVAWLGATAYLVRRRTVQAAVSHSGYAVAAVLLLVPLAAISPFVSVEGGIRGRSTLFVMLLVSVAVPAGIAAGVGWFAARFVPEGASKSEG